MDYICADNVSVKKLKNWDLKNFHKGGKNNMLNDTLANALSTMKNAEIKGKGTCIIQPSSKLIGGVLNLLKDKGYIHKFELVDDGKAGIFQVQLKGNINNCGVIKPRYPIKRDELDKWESRYLPAQHFGLLILTTTKGIVSQDEAKQNGIGGKLLAYIY
jgi:small subunit ribosomal protein S8